MNEYVADTHALLWYLLNSNKLGANASAAFEEGENGQALIYIPAIVFAELYFLNKKYGGLIDFAAEYKKLEQGGQYILIPLESGNILDFDKDSAVSEMHDRIIVGVSRRLNAPLMTIDRNIVNSKLVTTVW
jgi:PIN domain nuclease of toxin-antitoxin system